MSKIKYNELYETYAPKLKTLFSKKIIDEQEVEDLVQDTMLRVFEKLDTYDSKYAMTTWLYTVAYNVLYNHYRDKSKLTPLVFAKELYDNEHTESFDSPENILIAEQQQESITKTLTALTPEYLQVYQLKEIEGKSLNEIATQLSIPVNTVKSRLKRARDTIKVNLI